MCTIYRPFSRSQYVCVFAFVPRHFCPFFLVPKHAFRHTSDPFPDISIPFFSQLNALAVLFLAFCPFF